MRSWDNFSPASETKASRSISSIYCSSTDFVKPALSPPVNTYANLFAINSSCAEIFPCAFNPFTTVAIAVLPPAPGSFKSSRYYGGLYPSINSRAFRFAAQIR